jgi:hypothetical protein
LAKIFSLPVPSLHSFDAIRIGLKKIWHHPFTSLALCRRQNSAVLFHHPYNNVNYMTRNYLYLSFVLSGSFPRASSYLKAISLFLTINTVYLHLEIDRMDFYLSIHNANPMPLSQGSAISAPGIVIAFNVSTNVL